VISTWRLSNSTPDGGHTSAAEKAACLGVFFCATINEIRFMDRCHDLGSTDFAYSLAVNLGRAGRKLIEFRESIGTPLDQPLEIEDRQT
jgi:hypothetical protein